MAVGPSAPFKFDSVTGIDIGIETSGCGALVAIHVCSADGVRLDETDVLVQGIPACSLRTSILGIVVPDWVRAVGKGSLHVDTLDEAMGGCGVEEDGKSAEKERGGVHDRDCKREDL